MLGRSWREGGGVTVTRHGITGSNYRSSDSSPTGVSPYGNLLTAKAGARKSSAPVGTVVCLVGRFYLPRQPELGIERSTMEEQYVWFTPSEEAYGEVYAILTEEGWENL